MQAVRKGRFGSTSRLKRDGKIDPVDQINSGLSDVNSNSSVATKQFPFVPESLSDAALPVIPKELVLERSRQFKSNAGEAAEKEGMQSNEYWIVIDNVVYDCTDFASDHPGGEGTIQSFIGEDCSWQFWRLHSKNIMEQYGRALRVGKTEGIKNRFLETASYVGLSKLGDDGW